jgi:hypothetical protein
MSSTRADRGQNECVQMTRADLLTSARDRLPGRRQVAVSTVSAPRAHCSNGEAGHVQTRVGPVLAKTTVTRTSSGPGIGSVVWPAFSWPMFDAGPRTAPITAATVHQGWRASPCETDQCRYGVIESLSIANDQLGRAALPQPKQLRRQPPTLTRRRRRWLHSQKGRRPDPARGCLCDSGLTEGRSVH